jgi:hypothetical protein
MERGRLTAINQIWLEKLEITTEGDIDLRGFFGLDPKIVAGYRELLTQAVIKGDGTEEQFRRIHELLVPATSPNFHNITRAIKVSRHSSTGIGDIWAVLFLHKGRHRFTYCLVFQTQPNFPPPEIIA